MCVKGVGDACMAFRSSSEFLRCCFSSFCMLHSFLKFVFVLQKHSWPAPTTLPNASVWLIWDSDRFFLFGRILASLLALEAKICEGFPLPSQQVRV